MNHKLHIFREVRQPLNNIQNMPPHGVPPQQQIQQQPPGGGGGGGVGLPPPPKAMMRGQPVPQHMQGSFDGQQHHPHPPHLIIQVSWKSTDSKSSFLSTKDILT